MGKKISFIPKIRKTSIILHILCIYVCFLVKCNCEKSTYKLTNGGYKNVRKKRKYLIRRLDNNYEAFTGEIVRSIIGEIIDYCEDYSDFRDVCCDMFNDFNEYFYENDLNDLIEWYFDSLTGLLDYNFKNGESLKSKLIEWISDDFFYALNKHFIEIVELEQE